MLSLSKHEDRNASTMPTPQFCYYVAVSADGFIATKDGGVAWLDAYPADQFGFNEYMATISTIVMGRAAYDKSRTLGPWQFAGRRTIVLTSRPLADAPEGVETFRGDVTALAPELRATSAGDIWLFGGANSVRMFREAALIDRIELYVIPVLLGDGIRLFEPSSGEMKLTLIDARAMGAGVVRLVYTRA
jgi:dihydrofolate reductase